MFHVKHPGRLSTSYAAASPLCCFTWNILGVCLARKSLYWVARQLVGDGPTGEKVSASTGMIGRCATCNVPVACQLSTRPQDGCVVSRGTSPCLGTWWFVRMARCFGARAAVRASSAYSATRQVRSEPMGRGRRRVLEEPGDRRESVSRGTLLDTSSTHQRAAVRIPSDTARAPCLCPLAHRQHRPA